MVSTTFGLSSLFCSLMWPFMVCYFATYVTDRISSIGQIVYNSNWEDLTPKMRTNLLLVIVRSQKPMYFTGFDLILCTLETFGTVRTKLN